MKSLHSERLDSLSKIDSLQWSLDAERISWKKEWESERIQSDVDKVRKSTDEELESRFQSLLFHRGKRFEGVRKNCIWYGYSLMKTPITGSYGCRPKNLLGILPINAPAKSECKNDRITLDVYCEEHRLQANRALANGVESGIYVVTNRHSQAQVDISPIPLVSPSLIREELVKKVKAQKGEVAAEVREDKSELLRLTKRVKEIEKKLGLMRETLAGLESHLKRQRFPENIRLAIYREYDYKCAMCKIDLTLITPHIDHIKPLAKGGKDGRPNLQPLCEPCNLKKGSKYEE